MTTENFSMSQYLLSQCEGYTKFPPNNNFALGRMSYILELTNMIGFSRAQSFIDAQNVFKEIAPKLAKKTARRKKGA